MNKTNRIALVALAMTLGATSSWAQEAPSCQTLRMADVGWVDNGAINGLSMAVAEGLGYQTKVSTLSLPIILASVQDKKIDFFLDYWSPASDPMFQPAVANNSVTLADKPNLVGARFTLAVPSYLAADGLKDMSDIARYKNQLKGKIYGIESGAGGNKLIKTMIKENRYDLGDFELVESSEAAMRLQVARAIRNKEPIIFLGWAPHPMNLQFEMTYLSGADDLWGPDGGAAKVHTVMANDYQTRCPNAAKLVSNLRFDVAMESHMMEKIMNKEPAVDAAKKLIAKNPHWLDTWLEGVTTFDGQDGKAAVIKYLKL
ncbi:choline ABC transporter substrate-binding protein [Pseudomonas sp. MPC6]|uniref:choline ABC transporter substrate-binding protein n=1 Tax=unclassified Pseudomonas TaxID=196821 RepID=UPI0011106BEA|nr:choline ABC transporter substrate-binding protein [Pseudomonas sp. MPC6]QCY09421.1 choline ABC transporter substrate-binding protein [Pseudomonas sp. MPC6]